MPKATKKKKKLDSYKRKARSLRSSMRKYKISGVSTTQLEEMLRGGIVCPYCKEPVPTKQVSLDHIMPRSRGGADSLENTQFTCLGCNRFKGNLTHVEFLALLEFLAPWPIMYTNLRQRLKASGWIFGG